MTRVLVIDDEGLVRQGLRRIVEGADDLDVVGEASDGADAVDAVLRCRPDVVLMDIRMPVLDGLGATRAVRALDDPPEIIVLTTFDLDEYVFGALRAGANGFLLKAAEPRALIEGIRAVAAGKSILSPEVTRRLIAHFVDDPAAERREAARARFATLTERELDVVRALATGGSNADIAAALYMSEATVKSHVSRVLVKVGVDNRTALALEAVAAGVVANGAG